MSFQSTYIPKLKDMKYVPNIYDIWRMHAQNSVTQSNESLYVDDYNSEDYNNNNTRVSMMIHDSTR